MFNDLIEDNREQQITARTKWQGVGNVRSNQVVTVKNVVHSPKPESWQDTAMCGYEPWPMINADELNHHQ